MKKRNKVSAEFSMSSLTDIIFLLPIFFMLTSSLVIPNALNLKLPGKSSSNQPPSNEQPNIIAVSQSGSYTWNGGSVSQHTRPGSKAVLAVQLVYSQCGTLAGVTGRSQLRSGLYSWSDARCWSTTNAHWHAQRSRAA